MVYFSRKTFAAVLAMLPCTLAHSWIDNISTDESTGFIRGFMGHIDEFETYQTLNSDKGVALCKANQVDPTNYTTQFPRLQLKAGDSLVANYTENGHVTQDKLPPDNKPHPGNYSWFWTGVPFTGSISDGSQLLSFDNLSDSNRLSGPSNFDDGICAENDDNDLGRTGPRNCQSRITIPAGTQPGIYALYWVWDFTKLTAVDPSYLELYTSCMDVEVVAGDDSSDPSSSGSSNSTSTTGTATASAGDDGSVTTTFVTKTRTHTQTIDGGTSTATAVVTEGADPDIIIKTVFTQTFITVTRTVTAS